MSAARDRLASGYYNSLPKTIANPGGMDDGGHVINFPAALTDVATAGAEIIADNTATKAAILDDNAATALTISQNNSAILGAIAQNNADTAAAVAASAAAAVAAKTAAANSEGAATTKAAEAAASSATAVRLVMANFPDRVDATATAFTEALIGDPAAVASPAGAKIVNAAGYGYVYQSAGAATLAHKGLITAGQEYIIEITVEVEQTALGAGETAAARIRLQGLDKDYASTGANVTGPLVVTPVGVTTITRRFAYNAPSGGTAWPQPGVAVWLRPAVDVNRKSDDSGAAAGSTARVRRMSIRDVTAVVAAEVAAAASAASASAIAFSTSADAIAGSGPGVMGPALVASAIGAQAIAIGGCIQAAAPPGSRFLLWDGSSYLKASYPALAAILGDRYASWTVASPTLRSGYNYRGVYAEAGLVIAAGTLGNIQTSSDGVSWTERAASLTNFNEAAGAIKLAAKYLVHGFSANSTDRCLVSSANGTTGWADVAAFATFNNGQTGISSMAYGLVNGAATVVAVGGANGTTAQIRYSTDEGATWANGAAWGVGAAADQYSPRVMIANGVVAAWCPNPAVLRRGTSLASGLVDVAGLPSVPASIGVGNGLFVTVHASGALYTSPDLASFTMRDTPAGYPAFSSYLGFFNGAHHFQAALLGQQRVYATPDFANWWRVTMPQAISSLTGPFRAFGSKAVAPISTAGSIAVASFVHNPTTEFPVPPSNGGMPTYIKAL